MGGSGLQQGFPKQGMKCWEGEVKKPIINSASNISTILHVIREGMDRIVHQGERYREEAFAKFWFTEF